MLVHRSASWSSAASHVPPPSSRREARASLRYASTSGSIEFKRLNAAIRKGCFSTKSALSLSLDEPEEAPEDDKPVARLSTVYSGLSDSASDAATGVAAASTGPTPPGADAAAAQAQAPPATAATADSAPSAADIAAAELLFPGRGLPSSTSQLKLSLFEYKNNPPNAPNTP